LPAAPPADKKRHASSWGIVFEHFERWLMKLRKIHVRRQQLQQRIQAARKAKSAIVLKKK